MLVPRPQRLSLGTSTSPATALSPWKLSPTTAVWAALPGVLTALGSCQFLWHLRGTPGLWPTVRLRRWSPLPLWLSPVPGNEPLSPMTESAMPREAGTLPRVSWLGQDSRPPQLVPYLAGGRGFLHTCPSWATGPGGDQSPRASESLHLRFWLHKSLTRIGTSLAREGRTCQVAPAKQTIPAMYSLDIFVIRFQAFLAPLRAVTPFTLACRTQL